MKLYDYSNKEEVEVSDDFLERFNWISTTRSLFVKHLHIPYCSRDDDLCFDIEKRMKCKYFRDFIKHK